jgi:hypothetical protein
MNAEIPRLLAQLAANTACELDDLVRNIPNDLKDTKALVPILRSLVERCFPNNAISYDPSGITLVSQFLEGVGWPTKMVTVDDLIKETDVLCQQFESMWKSLPSRSLAAELRRISVELSKHAMARIEPYRRPCF